MRVFDLQRAFARARALAENFEDQAGAVEHLGVPGLFEIALLHGGERAIDDHQAGIKGLHQAGDFLDLALADIGRGPDIGDGNDAGFDARKIDRAREPDRLFEPRLRRTRFRRLRPSPDAPPVRADDDDTPDTRTGRAQPINLGVTRARFQIRLFPRPAPPRRLRTAGSGDPA